MSLSVFGAGTMGLGIALSAALGGRQVTVYDPDPASVERAPERLRREAGSGVSGGRWTRAEAAEAIERIRLTRAETDLLGSAIVIEAVPEDLSLKRRVLGRALELCGPDLVLATNTSSLRVAAIAAGLRSPGRLVGLHFFNPVPRMPLVEVVRGPETEECVVAAVNGLVAAMRKTAVPARDSVGFIVNRCLRPFYSEALRIVEDATATVEQVDLVMRDMCFPTGPFELIDLVGVDVNLDIQRSFYEQSFGEPRWRPSPLQAELVAAGNLGRKSGRGFYHYDGARPVREEAAPPSREIGLGRGLIRVTGRSLAARDLRRAAVRAGWSVDQPTSPWLTVSAGPPAPADAGCLAICCATTSLGSRPSQGAVGFCLPPSGRGELVELTRYGAGGAAAAERAEAFFASLGRRAVWVRDGPGLISSRMLATIVNEAYFALQEQVAEAADIDHAMRVGLNWPAGPFEFACSLGLRRVVAILDALRRELGDDRYRTAAGLRREAAASGEAAQQG